MGAGGERDRLAVHGQHVATDTNARQVARAGHVHEHGARRQLLLGDHASAGGGGHDQPGPAQGIGLLYDLDAS